MCCPCSKQNKKKPGQRMLPRFEKERKGGQHLLPPFEKKRNRGSKCCPHSKQKETGGSVSYSRCPRRRRWQYCSKWSGVWIPHRPIINVVEDKSPPLFGGDNQARTRRRVVFTPPCWLLVRKTGKGGARTASSFPGRFPCILIPPFPCLLAPFLHLPCSSLLPPVDFSTYIP